MITQRLIARVERSLIKRLNSEVRPHLERYALRSGNAEDFVLAASRLLVDPKQRQMFLASWMRRIQAGVHLEHDDTSPVPLDVPLGAVVEAGESVPLMALRPHPGTR